MRYASHGRTDRGRVRPHNEDDILVAPEDGVFAVADGMGGHAAGEVASRTAIQALRDALCGTRDESLPAGELLRRAVERANLEIARSIETHPEYRGMGTTIVVAMLKPDGGCAIAHVGDSRAYLVRDGAIRQLTTDHSFVNELVRLGMLSREQAARDPRRNVVTRALGSAQVVVPDVVEIRLEPGDVLLLCSDGLNTMLGDDEILAHVVAAGRDPAAMSERLVAAANDAGGEDNVSVVAIACEGDADPAAVRRTAPNRTLGPGTGGE